MSKETKEKYAVLMHHTFDPEKRVTDDFSDLEEAKAYLHWLWDEYYKGELKEESLDDNRPSYLDREKCYCEEDHAVVQWDDGDRTEFDLVPRVPKEEGFPKDWKKKAK